MTRNNSILMLSEHFSLDEATVSDTAARKGIDNTPPDKVLIVMKETAKCLEKVRMLLAVPIHVNSWYRCMALNGTVGSASTSQHLKGEAVDFIAPKFGTPLQICKAIIAARATIQFDQLILEHTWVHTSFAILNSVPRNKVLSLLADGSYASGLTDKQGKQL